MAAWTLAPVVEAPASAAKKALSCNLIFSLMMEMRAADWKHAEGRVMKGGTVHDSKERPTPTHLSGANTRRSGPKYCEALEKTISFSSATREREYWTWMSKISTVYTTTGVIYEACRKLPSGAKNLSQFFNLATNRLKM